LLDYVLHTPADPLRSHACVEQRYALIEKNLGAMKAMKIPASKPIGKKGSSRTKA
jgi:4-O-beta-D-mannosyl-D-glucose phosphorylase